MKLMIQLICVLIFQYLLRINLLVFEYINVMVIRSKLQSSKRTFSGSFVLEYLAAVLEVYILIFMKIYVMTNSFTTVSHIGGSHYSLRRTSFEKNFLLYYQADYSTKSVICFLFIFMVCLFHNIVCFFEFITI